MKNNKKDKNQKQRNASKNKIINVYKASKKSGSCVRLLIVPASSFVSSDDLHPILAKSMREMVRLAQIREEVMQVRSFAPI